MLISSILKGIEYKKSFADREATFITEDSRKASEGCVFVCVKGARFDGADKAREALDKGAVLLVAERDLQLPNQIIVKDARYAQSIMCRNFFKNPAKRLKLIGVTGTNGKTTTAFLIKECLELMGVKAGLIGTVKNMSGDREFPSVLTTPESFELYGLLREMADDGCKYCVMEVSSQALSQERTAGLHFDAGIFTNLTRDHLDYHGTMENYALAKSKLFENCSLSILNYDDDRSPFMAARSSGRFVMYSVGDDGADYTAKSIRYNPESVEYELVATGYAERVKVNIPGEFTVYNSMAAAVTLIELGFDFSKTAFVLSLCKGVKGRIEVVPTKTDYTVIIDYAHTPDGLLNIISSLRKIVNGRIITLFGCGGDRDKTKRPLMGAIASELSDVIVVTSDNPRSEDPDKIIEDILKGVKADKAKKIVITDRTKAIRAALNEAKEGDCVVLCGKGHETYQILKDGKIHFDEREIVKSILEENSK